jgi:hypothetical protein
VPTNGHRRIDVFHVGVDGVGVAAGVCELHADDVALRDPQRRAGNLAREGPGLEGDAGRDGDGGVDGRNLELPDATAVSLVDGLGQVVLARVAGVERPQVLVGVEVGRGVLPPSAEVAVVVFVVAVDGRGGRAASQSERARAGEGEPAQHRPPGDGGVVGHALDEPGLQSVGEVVGEAVVEPAHGTPASGRTVISSERSVASVRRSMIGFRLV